MYLKPADITICELVMDFGPALDGLTMSVMGQFEFSCELIPKVTAIHKLNYAELLVAACDIR